MFHVRLVTSRSAQEVLCQWLGVAQALAERDVEERKRLQDHFKMIGLQQPTVLWYLQCRVHEARVSQVVEAAEALCSRLLV